MTRGPPARLNPAQRTLCFPRMNSDWTCAQAGKLTEYQVSPLLSDATDALRYDCELVLECLSGEQMTVLPCWSEWPKYVYPSTQCLAEVSV